MVFHGYIASGKYPPPPDTTEILGLEVSGIVEEVGKGVKRFNCGDRVMALLSGGGYADEISVEEGLVMPVPSALTLEQV